MSAERAIVVSPRKSGTHLVQELMIGLGYRMFGETVTPVDSAVALSLRQRLELAERFLHPDELAGLDLHGDRDGFVRTTDALWFQVADMWQTKLAATNVSYAELALPELHHPLRMHPQAWRRPFSATPPEICWTFHSLDVWRVDQAFYSEWLSPAGPRMVLNHRDPRDTLISMASFLAGDGGHAIGRQPETAIFRPILRNLPDMSDRITYLLRDPAVPLLADFDAAICLLHHPDVCTVSFEDLVGAQGGGSTSRQVAAVKRVADHVESDADAAAVAEKVFNPNAYSFYRGQIGAWRDVFSRRHHQLFAARFGHLLEMFDYA